ncbi:uncharacterized protein THITE_2115022 [Thermothielavioides terrestris NRRL 8126]|uniref:Ubiquitin carrier protein n=1 Tax=Thermothielavioides terrestris (strain ATCC 38088 / NRRL 8126) TaxID=578455 RepID=G2R2M9_THETT|nr:uncharacterized protein THITE_2115022 [Thermothielavioides terrestris NRRL 8126]AEO66705.1 hypothetical protein THITE_2115022 [Thermothielavioides terrestris NRRL 8126]
MLSTVALAGGNALAKRLAAAAEEPRDWKLPPVTLFLFLGDIVLFLPVLVLINYTFNHVYTTLAAVEDPLPAYEALPMNDDGTPKPDDELAQRGRPITSSLRATYRLLCSLGSWRSNFRGLGYSAFIAFLMGLVTLFFCLLPFIPNFIAPLLALLAASPLLTAWTHFVITAPTTRRFSGRIPPLRKVYLATWLPTLLAWLAAQASVMLPIFLGRVLGLSLRDPTTPDRFRSTPLTPGEAGMSVGLVALSVALHALLAVPADVALTRVRASLLPADQDTLVPFDRSFGGRVEPEVVSGKGFATFGAALATVPWRSWVRIYLLRVKVFALSMAVYPVMAAVVIVQILLLRQVCEPDGEDGAKAYKCY